MATAIGSSSAVVPGALAERLRRTVALLERRGYALSADRLAEVCLGGTVAPELLPEAIRASGLAISAGMVVSAAAEARAAASVRPNASASAR